MEEHEDVRREAELARRYPVTQWPNFDKSIPFWSKVEKLTVHNKAKIEPASPNAALQPISTIDMALAEGIIRKLDAAQGSVPTDDKSAGAYETQHSHPDVVKAVKGDKKKYRDLYVRMGHRRARSARDRHDGDAAPGLGERVHGSRSVQLRGLSARTVPATIRSCSRSSSTSVPRAARGVAVSPIAP